MLQDNSRNKTWIFWIIVIHCLGLLVLGLLAYQKADGSHDLNLYYKSSRSLLAGKLPYRDFDFEYPPFALAAFVLPRIVTLGFLDNYHIYAFLLLLQNVLFSSIILILILRLTKYYNYHRQRIILGFYVLFAIILTPLIIWRYDVFPTLLTVLSLLAVISTRSTLAGISLGFGIAAKLYPIVLLPIFTAYYFAQKSYRAILNLWIGTIGAAILSFLPIAIATGNRVFSFLQYHEERGLQIESLPAGIIVLAHKLGLIDMKIKAAYGSINIVSPLDNLILNILPWLFMFGYTLILLSSIYSFRQERNQSESIKINALVNYTILALLIFIVTNKVFSPQYMVWIIPFAALLKPRKACLMLIICLSTYIMTLSGSFRNLDDMKILWLNLRNFLILGLSLWIFLSYFARQLKNLFR
ncbi:DUF2029 domain-containing protein [Nostocaceae cyanobacterium CENA369]|uniref:DUF2029 domain-containing protein n=1 Tax=Dendronalium phyllosphericum CENA369 TaxID=1725256 RepID=A0A8J7I4G6_9NOST|nr:glycosyltransferase family 87 protein [Dendronalium phyllosphericum]MBH8572307.1 DUF2029 domain-containing protein [Dendronalium phyllosphericum CENA369]